MVDVFAMKKETTRSMNQNKNTKKQASADFMRKDSAVICYSKEPMQKNKQLQNLFIYFFSYFSF